MKATDYEAMFANASESTRRLNGEAVATGVSPAKSQPATLPESVGGNAVQEGGARRARVSITVSRCRLLDPDNAVGGVKFLVDSLRYAGLITDDTARDIELEVRQIKVKTKAQQGTMIEVTPL